MGEASGAGTRSPELGLVSFWLPPNTRGNGLPAQSWAEIVVVSRHHAEQLLEAFREAGVAARIGPCGRPVIGEQDTCVWVDSAHYGHAENVLLRQLCR